MRKRRLRLCAYHLYLAASTPTPMNDGAHVNGKLFVDRPNNKRMQTDFGELALPSADDARRYAEDNEMKMRWN